MTSAPVAPGSLPREIVLSIAGASGIVVLVLLAIAVRPVPFAELDGAVQPEARAGSGTTRAASTTTKGDDEDGATSKPVAVPSGSSRELRARLSKEVRGGKLKDTVDTFEALLAADPRSAEDVDVRADIIELAAKAEYAGGRESDRVFGALGTKMGTMGPDVLYAIATSKGGSKAATRAVSVLKQEDVRARATPATLIAFDMWSTKSCPDKVALLDRARDDGDGRTLGWLQVMGRSCRMSKDPALEAAMDAIKSRLH
jgi:hypothetical protein